MPLLLPGNLLCSQNFHGALLHRHPEQPSVYALRCNAPYPYKPLELIEVLKGTRIQAQPIWGLIYQQAPYKGAFSYRIKKAVDYHNQVANLLCRSNLTQEDVLRVVDVLTETVKRNGRIFL